MNIEHIAIWTDDLEKSKEFYSKYFNGKENKKYRNENKNFESYFITFESGARLEIMKKPDFKRINKSFDYIWFSHLAFSVKGRNKVDDLTEKLRSDGFTVLSAPRTTGDGYYESLILDPDGNKIEITE